MKYKFNFQILNPRRKIFEVLEMADFLFNDFLLKTQRTYDFVLQFEKFLLQQKALQKLMQLLVNRCF